MAGSKHEPTLHGWDDKKVYYVDETGKERCVSDYPNLVAKLLGICQEYSARKAATATPE